MEKWIDKFRSEVFTANRAFVTYLTIDAVAGENVAVLNILNKNAATWMFLKHALLDELFITLGRIFDRRNDSFSVFYFIKKCKSNVCRFNEHALIKRKIEEQGGNIPVWLDEYIEGVYVPSCDDFDVLNRVGELAYGKYCGVYKGIRNKLIAHADVEAIFKAGEMFELTDVEVVKDVLNSLFLVYGAVSQLYLDGRKIELGAHNYREGEEEHVAKDVWGLFNALVKNS